MTFFAVLLFLVVSLSFVAGFSSTASNATPMRTNTALFAKKQQNRKKKAATSASGGGFGAAPKASDDGKVRSVSGFAGSGTKPLRVAANTFDRLQEEYGKDSTSDVYCKSPANDPELFWFVGKVVIRPNTAATPEQAVIAQKRLILEYAKRELRPQNLGGKYASSLELWLAPGDSEMDAVQNKISLTKVEGSMADLSEDFSVSDVGFNPEIYVGDEREKGGLRIKRDEEGKPVKSVFEINQ
jgi:hypothetical protein